MGGGRRAGREGRGTGGDLRVFFVRRAGRGASEAFERGRQGGGRRAIARARRDDDDDDDDDDARARARAAHAAERRATGTRAVTVVEDRAAGARREKTERRSAREGGRASCFSLSD